MSEREQSARTRRRWTRGQGGVRKRGRVWWVRYCPAGRRRRVEERTDAKNKTEAQAILNERLGDVSKGVTPAAASKTRVAEPRLTTSLFSSTTSPTIPASCSPSS